MKPQKNPATPAEWQEAVDAAHVSLVIDSAQQYGLMECNFKVNAQRALELLEAGKLRGYEPAGDAVERFVLAWAAADPRAEEEK